MKRFVVTILTLTLIFAFVGCNEKDAVSDIDTSNMPSDNSTSNITNTESIESNTTVESSSKNETVSKPTESSKPVIDNTSSNNNSSSTQTPTVTYKDVKIGRWSLTKRCHYSNLAVEVVKYILDFDMSDSEIWGPQGQCREQEFYPISRLFPEYHEDYRNRGNVISFEGNEYYTEGWECFLSIENIVVENNETSFVLEYDYFPDGSHTSARANVNVVIEQISDNEIKIINMDGNHPCLSIGDVFKRIE